MHNVAQPDGTRVKDRWIKTMRVLTYLLMFVAGICLILSPFLSLIYIGTAEAMAWFLTVGGLTSALGAFFERWVGEYVGVPLLASAFGVFGVISFAGAVEETPYLASANLALLLAVMFGLLTRWREARVVCRLSMHMAKRKDTRL